MDLLIELVFAVAFLLECLLVVDQHQILANQELLDLFVRLASFARCGVARVEGEKDFLTMK